MGHLWYWYWYWLGTNNWLSLVSPKLKVGTKIREGLSYLSGPGYFRLIVITLLPGLLLEISICFPTSMTHRRMASWVVYFNKGMVSRPGCNRLWFRGLFLYMAWVLSIYKFSLSHTFELSKIKSFNFYRTLKR